MCNKPLRLWEFLQESQEFLEIHGMTNTNIRYYWLMAFDWDLTQLVTHLNQEVSAENIDYFQKVLERLIHHEPIQYIVGYADFHGERFKVTPDTLIPREETTGLIDIADNWLKERPNDRVLDIGTGTGILPIILKKKHPHVQVTACDLSSTALQIARENADSHHVDITWLESDLTAEVPGTFDLVISNPPYIAEEELEEMDESVKRYEPALALFADNQGLEIYERLACELPNLLAKDGRIALEIGYRQGRAVTKIFEEAFPTASIHVHPDFNGLDRFVTVNLAKEDGNA